MTDILKVIQYINPDAKCQITNNDVDSIEWYDTTPISAEDINSKISEYETAEATKKTNSESERASGKTKLKDLGLTDDEIKALLGK
jgi:hypothetical protein